MDNDGKNKNNCKFLITLKHIPWFDGKHVVFGQVINGMEIIDQIENIETNNEDKPLKKIIIVNCGEVKKEGNVDNKIINGNKIENNKENNKIEIEDNVILDKKDENKKEEIKGNLNQINSNNLYQKEEVKNIEIIKEEGENKTEENKKENI